MRHHLLLSELSIERFKLLRTRNVAARIIVQAEFTHKESFSPSKINGTIEILSGASRNAKNIKSVVAMIIVADATI